MAQCLVLCELVYPVNQFRFKTQGNQKPTIILSQSKFFRQIDVPLQCICISTSALPYLLLLLLANLQPTTLSSNPSPIRIKHELLSNPNFNPNFSPQARVKSFVVKRHVIQSSYHCIASRSYPTSKAHTFQSHPATQTEPALIPIHL